MRARLGLLIGKARVGGGVGEFLFLDLLDVRGIGNVVGADTASCAEEEC